MLTIISILPVLILLINNSFSFAEIPKEIKCYYSEDEINFNKNAQSRSFSNKTDFERRDLSLTLGADDIEVCILTVIYFNLKFGSKSRSIVNALALS